MCGRFTLTKTPEQLNTYLDRLEIAPIGSFTPQYNIAPSQNILSIVVKENQWQTEYLRWGLIPPWSKQGLKSKPLINARRETLAEKASFKHALVSRRCLILADGFYEWSHDSHGKNPLFFQLNDRPLFAFAGLWESWQNNDGKTIHSTTIINTSAQGVMGEIHPRMPVVLSPDVYDNWLDRDITDTKYLNELLLNNLGTKFNYYPVTQKVNSVKNNSPDLLKKEKVIVTQQLSLF